MKRETLAIIGFALIVSAFAFSKMNWEKKAELPPQQEASPTLSLPEPSKKGVISVEEALAKRRSQREYAREPLSLDELSQLLWAAQGVTGESGRTAPSAGGTYPLEVYAVVGDVSGLPSGVYRYTPKEHSLVLVKAGDFRENLSTASLNQKWVRDATVDLVFTAVYERTTRQYGERGIRYVHMEAGHAAQNVYLECEALGLGTVTVGAFDDKEVAGLFSLPDGETPLYVMPVGKPS